MGVLRWLKAVFIGERFSWRGFAVAGVTFANPDGVSRQKIARALQPGDNAWLEHEPDNPYSSEALAVWTDQGQIGYVPARRCGWVKKALLAGDLLALQVESTGRVGQDGDYDDTPTGPYGVRVRVALKDGSRFAKG